MAHQSNQYDLDVYGQHVSLRLDPRLYDPANKNILGPHDYFLPGTASVCMVNLLYGKRRRVFVDDDHQEITHYRGKAGSHLIRQLVCYLAAWHTRAFDIVHGTGLLADSKRNLGILLVGGAHCGKSTLSARLGNIIMDDDIMVVTRDTMKVAGKMGFVTYKHPDTGRKYLTPLPNGVKEARVDLVFLLDKHHTGGTYADVDNRIPRRFACLSDLPPALTKAYLDLPPIKVDAPIFRIGTRGRLPETLRTLEHIINQHI